MTTPTPRWTAVDVNRIAMTDALHQRDTKPRGVFCRCQRWDRAVPYNATAVAVAHQQHRTDELLSAFAAVLRDMPRDAGEGSPFQLIADAVADVSYAGQKGSPEATAGTSPTQPFTHSSYCSIERCTLVADERWTAETEELVARAIYGRRTGTNVDGFTEWDWDNAPLSADARRAWRKRAASVLTALADAGVLTAVGGETRQSSEYGVANVSFEGGVRQCGCDVNGFTGHTHVRSVTTYTVVGPWREVTDGPT